LWFIKSVEERTFFEVRVNQAYLALQPHNKGREVVVDPVIACAALVVAAKVDWGEVGINAHANLFPMIETKIVGLRVNPN